MKDGTTSGIGATEVADDWYDIEWSTIQERVKNLRQRIYRATQQKKWNKVRSLTKLMLRSYSNVLLSVRRVTQDNPGKKTAGVDKQVVLSARGKLRLIRHMLKYKLWQAKPTRRVYIPKAGGKRPLGIPTVKNRVAQAIVKNALEPSWEARFEASSYGFRPGRSCHDAIAHCWLRLNRRSRHRWVLDADIKGAFDNISHDFIINALRFSPGRELVKQWLKAGYVEAEVLYKTESGVPQGGVISPLLANIALNGIEKVIGKSYGFIRYADDFVVTAKRKYDLNRFVIPKLKRWLEERGLELNMDKTRIVSIDDGFNFLGFNIRRYRGKCLIKPEKAKVLKLLRRLTDWLKLHRQSTPHEVVLYFNSVLRGWGNYYRYACSKEAFGYIDTCVWRMLWRWSLRRHPNKGTDWVKRKYFHYSHGRAWRFTGTTKTKYGEVIHVPIFDISAIRIKRHVKVKGGHSIDDPALNSYWVWRKERLKSASGGDELIGVQLC